MTAGNNVGGFVLVDGRRVTAVVVTHMDDENEWVALVELDHADVLDVYEHRNYVRPQVDRARLQLQCLLFDDGSGIKGFINELARRSGLPELGEEQ